MASADIDIRAAARALMMVLAVLLATPTLLIATRDDAQVRFAHRRDLSPPPPVHALAHQPVVFFESAADWHRDRIFFGVHAGRLYRWLLYHWLSDGAAVNVDRGKNNMVFLTAHGGRSGFGSFDKSCPAVSRWPDLSAEIRADWGKLLDSFRAQNQSAVLLIIPSKKVLYPEQFSARVPTHLKLRCQRMRQAGNPISGLADAFPDSVIDVYPALLPYKDRPHFYPPENFHSDGESSARAVDEVVRHWFGAAIVPASGQAYRHIDASADMSGVLGFGRQIVLRTPIDFDPSVPQLDSAFAARVEQRLGVEVYATRHNHPGAERDQRLLLIANSFGARTAPYFARYFAAVDLIQTNRLRTPSDHARLFNQFAFSGDYDRIVFVLHEESVFERRLGKYGAAFEAGTD